MALEKARWLAYAALYWSLGPEAQEHHPVVDSHMGAKRLL